MIVYGSSLSPYVRKTLAFATEKGIEVEVQPAGMGQGPPEFKIASPFGKMPGFRDGDFLLCDSTAIITYLDAIKPDPNLLPTDPKARARTIWYEEFADTILIGAMGAIFFNRFVAPRFLGREGDLALADKAEKTDLPPMIDYIESVLPASGHLVEDRLTLADLAVASPFVNLAFLGVNVDGAKHPKTRSFLDKIHARPSFAPLIAQDRAFFAG
jgi:glutathione S-transferase